MVTVLHHDLKNCYERLTQPPHIAGPLAGIPNVRYYSIKFLSERQKLIYYYKFLAKVNFVTPRLLILIFAVSLDSGKKAT